MSSIVTPFSGSNSESQQVEIVSVNCSAESSETVDFLYGDVRGIWLEAAENNFPRKDGWKVLGITFDDNSSSTHKSEFQSLAKNCTFVGIDGTLPYSSGSAGIMISYYNHSNADITIHQDIFKGVMVVGRVVSS